MLQNGAKSYHLDRLDGPRGEMIQNDTKSNHLDRLGGAGCEMIQVPFKSCIKSCNLDRLGDPLRGFW